MYTYNISMCPMYILYTYTFAHLACVPFQLLISLFCPIDQRLTSRVPKRLPHRSTTHPAIGLHLPRPAGGKNPCAPAEGVYIYMASHVMTTLLFSSLHCRLLFEYVERPTKLNNSSCSQLKSLLFRKLVKPGNICCNHFFNTPNFDKTSPPSEEY